MGIRLKALCLSGLGLLILSCLVSCSGGSRHIDTKLVGLDSKDYSALKQEHVFQAIHYPPPSFLIALPCFTVQGFGKLGGSSRSCPNANSDGSKIPVEALPADPASSLAMEFVTLWKEKMELTNVEITHISMDKEIVPAVEPYQPPAKRDLRTFDFRVIEWGLYSRPERQYMLQLVTRARLLHSRYSQFVPFTRWAAICIKQGPTASLDQWKADRDSQLREKLNELVQLCAKDLLEQFEGGPRSQGAEKTTN